MQLSKEQIKNGWRVVKLGEVVTILDGDRGSNYPKQNEFFDNEFCLFLNTKNVSGQTFDFQEKMFITKEKSELLRKGKMLRGDYVLTTRGTLGNFAYYSDKITYENVRINSGMVILRTENVILNNKFLGQYLNSSFFKKQVSSRASGSAQPQLPIRDLSTFEIPLPPLKIQEKIAGVLCAFDDLIENNDRRIKVLEAMAQKLYTQWFVNFKFPGHEKTKMVDCENPDFGMVPEGWEVKKLGNICEIVLGGTPSRAKEEYWENGNIPWINSGAVNNFRITKESEFITELALKKSATKLLPKKTTVLAITGATLGQVSLTEIECCANQSVIGVYDKDKVLDLYIYLKINEIIESIISHANGGAQQHINKDVVNNVLVIIPEEKILLNFNKIVDPIFEEISKLLFTNQNLKKSRDFLIPQLVSGRVGIR